MTARVIDGQFKPHAAGSFSLGKAHAFAAKTAAPNQIWQTGFTCLKVIRRGRFYLLAMRNDHPSTSPAGGFRGTMLAEAATDGRDIALITPGCNDLRILQKPQLCGDKGWSCITEDLAEFRAGKHKNAHCITITVNLVAPSALPPHARPADLLSECAARQTRFRLSRP